MYDSSVFSSVLLSLREVRWVCMMCLCSCLCCVLLFELFVEYVWCVCCLPWCASLECCGYCCDVWLLLLYVRCNHPHLVSTGYPYQISSRIVLTGFSHKFTGDRSVW